MTEVAVPFPVTGLRRYDHSSASAQARLRARYRAERRFRLYGVTALGLTSLFLVALIVNIVLEGLPAFWQHRVVLDTPLSAGQFDANGGLTPAAIRAADYNGMGRKALAAALPSVESRAAKRKLYSILSNGAGDRLRKEVEANPSLIGQTVKASYLLSASADLYLKGQDGKTSVFSETRGIATPTGRSGEVTIFVGANDFAGVVQDVKRELKTRAMALKKEADRLANGGGAEERVKELRAEAASLEQRYTSPGGAETLDGRTPSRLVAINGGMVKLTSVSASQATGEALIPLTSVDDAQPGSWSLVTYETPENHRNVDDYVVTYLERLKSEGKIENSFNWAFFTTGDSREPELAGVFGAIVGSALMLTVTLALCLPIGVMAAIYLEEFAPKNWFTDLVEININNLAAVPSIVFGLLGLAVFLNFFGLPRSAPLVGGLVMALLVLPTIIIASRAALKAVPPSIKEAALGVGASKQQAIIDHVLPFAMPGIMTGTIIGMAHALGETAPLLMIGMIAFIVDIPHSFTEAASALPVQIYLWSDLPERAFQAKTSAAIIVLLVFLFVMNGTAIWLRKRFEKRW